MSRGMGPTSLDQLWKNVKRYVAYAVAGEASPPVGYYLISSTATNPSASGYAGTWVLEGSATCYTFPGSGTYPGAATNVWGGSGGHYVWRRTA
ncbi:MAG: hypothetical protein IKG69_06860 [Atopobiaceae bacterium]|nr:hypothetical protein [Atopobiaceae bacterium]